MNPPSRKTKRQEREEKGQRYSTIDHHLDLIAERGYTVKQRIPALPGYLGLTPMAQAILDEAKKKNGN